MSYCVYFHINKITDGVFYVGIGNQKRPYSKRSRSTFWKNVVDKYGYSVEVIHTNLTFYEACEFEKKYITEFGRLDIGTGILVNLTDGGEGSVGYKHTDENINRIKEHWTNYRGFELPENPDEYNREYNRKYARKYRECDEVRLTYQKSSRDRYHSMSTSEKEELKLKKKEYRDNLSEDQKLKNKEYQKNYKLNMSEEQKEKQRKKNRENMRKKKLENEKK